MASVLHFRTSASTSKFFRSSSSDFLLSSTSALQKLQLVVDKTQFKTTVYVLHLILFHFSGSADAFLTLDSDVGPEARVLGGREVKFLISPRVYEIGITQIIIVKGNRVPNAFPPT